MNHTPCRGWCPGDPGVGSHRLDRLRALPVDPTLTRLAGGPRSGGFGRFARVKVFELEGPDTLEATEEAIEPQAPIPH